MLRFLRAALLRPDSRTPVRVFSLVAVTLVASSGARAANAQAPMTIALARTTIAPACPAADDSTRTRPSLAPVDSAPCAARSAAAEAPAVRHRSALPYVFVGGLAAGLVANRFAHLDSDPGGYNDTWGTESYFPDKGVHALSAFALTTVGVDLKLSPWKSAAAVCAAGALFETTQGYVSRHDIAADCIGAGLAGAWRHWRAR